jgi:tetratricopeptide (TPR) repeat protein
LGQGTSATKIFQRLANAIASRPGGIDHVTSLAPVGPLVLAGLGEYTKAIAAAQRQIDLNRDDMLELAKAKTALAQVFALKGDRDAAIALLPELLDIPAGPTPALFALDPIWDSLRDDPRFIALTRQPIAEYKAAQR